MAGRSATAAGRERPPASLPAGSAAPGAAALAANGLPVAHSRELLRSRLYLRAALPTVKVLLGDDAHTSTTNRKS